MENVSTILVGKPEGQRPGARPWHIREDIKETGCESVVWIQLACYRVQWWILVDTVMNLKSSVKGGEFLH
jgi:hypothetical protein